VGFVPAEASKMRGSKMRGSKMRSSKMRGSNMKLPKLPAFKVAHLVFYLVGGIATYFCVSWSSDCIRDVG
jgi:hypothetical protein